MIDSALGLDPNDMSDAAKTKRQLRGLADLGGIAFVAKITVEASDRYGDKNRLDRPVLPNEKEWALVMEGKDVTPIPSQRKKESSPGPAAGGGQPAWQQPGSAPAAKVPAQTSAPPAWQQSAAPASAPAAAAPAQPAGPAWLNT
jgi:hypothetical protein